MEKDTMKVPEPLGAFLMAKGAVTGWIEELDLKVFVLPLNVNSPDRFKTEIIWSEEEPELLYVAEEKLRGLTIVPHKEVIYNYNNLHNVAKENYVKILAELDELKIKYTLNEERINL